MLYWIRILWADGGEPTTIADTRWAYICETAKENTRAIPAGTYQLWRMTPDGSEKLLTALEVH